VQIKANQDVREYKEVVYFGMTLRQLIFSGLAGAAALGVYLLCNRRMSMEAVSWLCVAAALPFGAFGFVRWHGMAFEQIIGVLIRSRLTLGKLVFFRTDNPHKALISSYLREKGKVKDCYQAKRK